MFPRTIARSFRSAVRVSRPVLTPRAVRPVALGQLSRLTLSTRGYSAAAKLKEEEDEDFFVHAEPSHTSQPQDLAAPAAQSDAVATAEDTDGFFTPELTADPVVEQAAPQTTSSPDAPVSSPNAKALVPFHDLKGRMDHDTLKALTFKPFNLLAMSEVQKRVLGRMPEIAGGKTSAQLVAAETPEEAEARLEREKAGREDLLVKAKTGTGKTIAFLVPAINARFHTLDKICGTSETTDPSKMGQHRRLVTRSHVGALVISPTRELATQIANEALKLMTWHKEMQVQLFVGGGNRMNQLKDFKSIRKGRKDIIVATPGRLRDVLSEPVVAEALATTDMLILDEADTLLEMGFRSDLDFILEHLPKERQTFLFSATVSKEIRDISRSFLKPNHTVIDCVPKNESNVHLHVPQYVTKLESAEEQLPHILRLIAHDQLTNPDSKVIVFLPTTKQTMLFATLLRESAASLPDRLAVHEIHSRLSQDQRSRAAERFRRDKRASVLVTSDVSARGVDYPGVTRVIQVGMPSSSDQYVHRVGRTGRGGSTGGRGDLILLPFEGEFTANLRKMPVKPMTVDTLKEELNSLTADKQDVAEKLAGIEGKVEQLLPMLDPEAVNDVFNSLIGYYIAKSDQLGCSKMDILDGLKEWSVGGAGLANPPYVSDSFMAKLGITNKPSRGGRVGRGGGSRSSFGMSRGDGDRGDRSFGRSDSGRGDREGRREQTCYNCQQPGHMAYECTEPRTERRHSSGSRGGFGNGRSDRGDRRGGNDRRGSHSERPSRSGFDSKFSERRPATPRQSWNDRGADRD